MKTLLEVLKATTHYLQEKGIEQPRREAEEILARALGITRMQLYLDFERPLPEDELTICRSFLQRRLKGEPFAYIAGKQQFLKCDITVNRAVLIPRQETEILADQIVSVLKKENLEGKRLLDLCCGTGCLGLSIKKECPDLQVTLSDISSDALAVAKENGLANSLTVEYVQGDLLHPFSNGSTEKFDYIVCNPPYISESAYATLSPDVKDYEPKLALVSGSTGLEIYERLSRSLPQVLRSGGKVWFEIGFDQGESVPAIFNDPCWKNKILSNDWAGHNRFFFLEIE